MKNTGNNIGIINGLRGFAILAVIYHHMFFGYTGPGTHSLEIANLTIFPLTYLSNGWLGVNLFFILSGFVLAYPYLLGKRAFDTGSDIKSFYFHRSKRLLPLYYISSVISIIFIVHHPDSAVAFAKELFFLITATFNFTGETYFPRYNWLLWSLGIEIWFSILFPFIIMAIKKYGLINTLFFILILSLITRIIGNNEIFDIGIPIINPVKDSILGRLDEFAWGILLCHIYIHKIHKLSVFNTWSAFFAGIILITTACMMWDAYRLHSLARGFIPFINIILDLGFVLFAMSLLAMKENVIKWTFSNYLIQLFGVMCYSLYVWHGVAIKTFVDSYDFAHIASYFVLLFVLAALSYRYIEFGHLSDTRKLFLLKSNTSPKVNSASKKRKEAIGSA